MLDLGRTRMVANDLALSWLTKEARNGKIVGDLSQS